MTKDDDAKHDDKDDKGREVAGQLEEQVKDLIGKLGKELEPVGEEVRKALEQAAREVHESLEEEGLSVEGLRRAIEKSYAELRGAVEQGGPVNEEMRKAMERTRKEMREAVRTRTRGHGARSQGRGTRSRRVCVGGGTKDSAIAIASERSAHLALDTRRLEPNAPGTSRRKAPPTTARIDRVANS